MSVIMRKPEICIAPEDPRLPDVRRLIAESDAVMQTLYPSESNHLASADALAAADTVFLVARRDVRLSDRSRLRPRPED